MRIQLGLWVCMLLSFIPLCAMELKQISLVSEKADFSPEPIVTLRFPGDQSKLEGGKPISEEDYKYPRSDLGHFELIDNMLKDLDYASDIPIELHNTQHKYFNLALQLAKLCFTDNITTPKPLHHKQRMRIREWFKGKSLDNLSGLLQCLNYVGAPELLKDLALKECVERIKKTHKFDPILNSIVHDLVNKMRPWFINPVVQYLKGLPDIISIKEVEKRNFPLKNLKILDQSKIVFSKDGTLVAISQGLIQQKIFFIDLRRSTRIDSLTAVFEDVSSFNHGGTYFASIGPVFITMHSLTSDPDIHITHDAFLFFGENPTCCAFSSDDTQLVVGHSTGRVIAYDIQQRTVLESYASNVGSITSVTYHPYDPTMIAFAVKKEVYVFYPSENKEGTIIARFGDHVVLSPHDPLTIEQVLSVAFTPDGEYIVAVYRSIDQKIHSVCYSANENFAKVAVAHSHKSYKNITSAKIYINEMRYVIDMKKPNGKSDILTGKIGKTLLVPQLAHISYFSICGNLLKYVSGGGPDTRTCIRSLLNDKNLPSTVATTQNYKPFAGFIENGTKMRIAANNELHTLHLYSEPWISLFEFLNPKTNQLTLQELHTLYNTYSGFADKNDVPVEKICETLKQTMSGSPKFMEQIEKCCPGQKQKVADTTKLVTQRKQGIVSLKKLKAVREAGFGTKFKQKIAEYAQQRASKGLLSYALQRNQPAVGPAVPVIAQQPAIAQAQQPQPVAVVPVSQPIPVMQPVAQQGIVSRTVSFITAPFRNLWSLAIRVWNSVFGD